MLPHSFGLIAFSHLFMLYRPTELQEVCICLFGDKSEMDATMLGNHVSRFSHAERSSNYRLRCDYTSRKVRELRCALQDNALNASLHARNFKIMCSLSKCQDGRLCEVPRSRVLGVGKWHNFSPTRTVMDSYISSCHMPT